MYVCMAAATLNNLYKFMPIIAGCIYWTRKQSGVHQILKVYKEHVRVSAVNTHTQNSVRNNSMFIKAILQLVWLFKNLLTKRAANSAGISQIPWLEKVNHHVFKHGVVE